jgi:hypothetical protein
MRSRRVRKNGRRKTAQSEIDPRFARVVQAFARDRSVTRGGTRGFGSGALKVKGAIFAMMSSKGRFVVKLRKERVDELVAARKGEPFDPGTGRRMKEWLAVDAASTEWIGVAKEARDFVSRRKH